MKALVLTAGLLAFLPLAAMAQSDPAKARSEIMRGIQTNGFNPLRTMTQGKMPFDKAAVEQAYAVIQSGLDKATGLWPANTPSNPEGRFGSSPKVWENKADFDNKLNEAKKFAAGSPAQAVSSLEGLTAVLKPLDASCSNCHETYRVRYR